MRYTARHFNNAFGTTYCYLLLVLCIGCVHAKRKHTHGSTLQFEMEIISSERNKPMGNYEDYLYWRKEQKGKRTYWHCLFYRVGADEKAESKCPVVSKRENQANQKIAEKKARTEVDVITLDDTFVKRFSDEGVILYFEVPSPNFQTNQNPSENKDLIKEYKPFLSAEAFDKLVSIYANKSLLVIDKLKELDDVFMGLPEDVLAKLPTPKAFRRLPQQVQSQVHSIYYSKSINFEEKLKKLEELVHNLPHEQIKLIPIQKDLPGLIEFDVPVLLQFNGQIETHLLRNYLSEQDFDTLSKILTSRSKMPEVTRARLIGKLLKEAYQKNPTKFPLPLGEEDADVPEDIRRLGIHLMFSRNPFDNIDPFTKALKILKGGKAELEVGEKQVDEPEGELDSWVEQAFEDASAGDNTLQKQQPRYAFLDDAGLSADEGTTQAKPRRQPWPRKWKKIQQFIKSFKGSIHD